MNKLSLATILVISLVLFATFIDIVDALHAYAPPPHGASTPPLPPPPHHVSTPPPYGVSTPPPSPSPRTPAMPRFCWKKCAYRCSRNPRALCKKLCMKCCAICKSVPVGPYGDKSKYPCYDSIKGKRGQSKCP